MADVSVRPARRADVPAIAAVHAAAWLTAYAGLLPPAMTASLTPESLTDEWARAADLADAASAVLLVAESGSSVVGLAAAAPGQEADDQPGDFELLTLAVAPAAQRQGHGSRLLAALADTLSERGCSRAYAWLAEEDGAGRDFLAGAGWAPDGATRTLATEDDSASLAQLRLHTTLPGAPA